MTNNAASHNYSSLRDVRAAPDTLIREGTFFIWGGGEGEREGGLVGRGFGGEGY